MAIHFNSYAFNISVGSSGMYVYVYFVTHTLVCYIKHAKVFEVYNKISNAQEYNHIVVFSKAYEAND